MRVELRALRAKIRGFELESSSLRRRISELKGAKRCAAREQKKRLGQFTREHLLAYGLLRGLAYDRIEPTSQTPVNQESLLATVLLHAPMWERKKWTPERLETWLSRHEEHSPAQTVSLTLADAQPPVSVAVSSPPPLTPSQSLLSRIIGLLK